MKREKDKNAVVQRCPILETCVILYAPEENHEGSAVIHCMVYKALSVHLSFEFSIHFDVLQ